MMTAFGLALVLSVGVLTILLGLLIWKKGKISLIHSYHYVKVREEDKKAYTEMFGKGVSVIGFGLVITAFVDSITKSPYAWICFWVCFIIGFVLIGKAQKKYNGGFF